MIQAKGIGISRLWEPDNAKKELEEKMLEKIKETLEKIKDKAQDEK
jgi:hypothetical protein